MNSAIIFLSLMLIFFAIMLVIKIKIKFDLYENYLQIEIYLYGMKVLKIYISLIGLYYQINNSKKLKTINLVIKKEDEYFVMQIKKSIIDKLYFDDVFLVSKIGIKDASTSVLIVAFLNTLLSRASTKIYSTDSDIRLYFKNDVDFLNKKIFIDASIKVYFTIFDLVFAIILSFYKRGKYVKERNKQKYW